MSFYHLSSYIAIFTFFVVICQILISVHAQTVGMFEDERPSKTFAVTKTSPQFEIELDYNKAFDVTIKAFDDLEGQTGFCEVTPSEISIKMDWTGPFPSDEQKQHSYENIIYFKGYYFILDSISFSILATSDVKDSSKYYTILSDFNNDINDSSQFEEPFMVVDETFGILYIVTKKNLYSYDLNHFLNDVKNPKNIQPIDTAALGSYYKGYNSIFNVVHLKDTLFVVADEIVDVFLTDKHGVITPKIKLNAEFFQVNTTSIIDIAWNGNYTFVLDSLLGVFVVDMTDFFTDQSKSLINLPKLRLNVAKAEFIEVISTSLSLIFSTTKNPFIQEYIIIGNPITSIVLNRKIQSFQSVRDTYSDKNFLYLLTGFFNMATKHSIPEKYTTEKAKDFLAEYWPLFGIKAMVSVTSNSTSKIVAIQDEFITAYTFTERNPILYCNIQNIPEGTYAFSIQAVQSFCSLKDKNPEQTSWDSVCIIKESLRIMVTDDASSIGNLTESNKQVFMLMVGVGLLGALVFLCILMCGKYRIQYRRLEDQIRFHKIENDTTDQGAGQGGKKNLQSGNAVANSELEINPDNINIQAELEKAEAEERTKAEKQGIRFEDVKPNADFGDIKPLDFEAIYGSAKGDTSF